ncbi:MAG: DNA translocase FtsK 4TM domain-containing protein [Gammaproteobacteria bacterium]|nr:DNA translocase FtsK 4TM domain-containing protein [Gammaproteobacteria bacterium]
MENFMAHRLTEGALIGLVVLCAWLSLALLTYHPDDPGWTYTGINQQVANSMGLSGAWIADVLFFLIGYMAYILPLVAAYQAWLVFRTRAEKPAFHWMLLTVRFGGLILVLVAGTAIASLHFYSNGITLREGSGGILGRMTADGLITAFSYIGATLIAIASFLFGLVLFTDISWLAVMEGTGRVSMELWERLVLRWYDLRSRYRDRKQSRESTAERRKALQKQVEKNLTRKAPVIDVAPAKPQISERVEREKQGTLFKVPTTDSLPALHLLDEDIKDSSRGYSEDDLEAMSRLLEIKLQDYSIEAEVVAVHPGPVITRFEVQPAPGVKVSKITSLVKDLARSLAVTSVRVVEVIPGKSVVGIEIPNVDREVVKLSTVLSSKHYDASTSPLSLALGQDISGLPVVVDLAKMPHLLVAGTTGSGKSVGLNSMILSILFKASPEQVRLIMVDPKMLELAIYEGIPHLLTPVVTDMKDAANALRWCVAEMERRYRLMAALGVRNISGFNKKVRDAEKAGQPIKDPTWVPQPGLFVDDVVDDDPPDLEALPFIVVIIDEFADMMMIVGKKVEELIARIAQKARAAGIHLILATQRPSVDVITGLIKANIPTRIAYQVSSKVDSRTILDQGGAEQLLGHGDMLYLPSGSPLPIRVHGAFVDDDEVHRVVDSWKELAEPNYLDEILDARTDAEVLPSPANGSTDDDVEQDPLYDEAVAFVMETRRASISSVQRKLRIGYNRAARLIEGMEAAGIVSEMNSNGSREVLVGDNQ